MKDVVIRDAKASDAHGIAKVHVASWQCAYRGQVPDTFLNSMSVKKREEVWKKMLENHDVGTHMLVAERNGEIVGWVTGGKSRDKDSSPDMGELHGIYIHPNFTGQGIGTGLLSAMMEKLNHDGYKRVTLWVLTSNERTRKWYASRGWMNEGKTKIEPRDGFELHEVRYYRELK